MTLAEELQINYLAHARHDIMVFPGVWHSSTPDIGLRDSTQTVPKTVRDYYIQLPILKCLSLPLIELYSGGWHYDVMSIGLSMLANRPSHDLKAWLDECAHSTGSDITVASTNHGCGHGFIALSSDVKHSIDASLNGIVRSTLSIEPYLQARSYNSDGLA